MQVIDVDAEITRRRRNRRGRYPEQFRDGHGEYGAPFGAIVDGYQFQEFGIWHRIDEAGLIDLELFRSSAYPFRNATSADAEQVWRESIGELDLVGAI